MFLSFRVAWFYKVCRHSNQFYRSFLNQPKHLRTNLKVFTVLIKTCSTILMILTDAFCVGDAECRASVHWREWERERVVYWPDVSSLLRSLLGLSVSDMSDSLASIWFPTRTQTHTDTHKHKRTRTLARRALKRWDRLWTVVHWLAVL